jgi:hypothetical protein
VSEEEEPVTPEEEDGLLLAEGFDKAFIGTTYCKQAKAELAVYDRDKCFKVLMERDGMTFIEAVDFFMYNTEGAYMGDLTPLFIELSTLEEALEDRS